MGNREGPSETQQGISPMWRARGVGIGQTGAKIRTSALRGWTSCGHISHLGALVTRIRRPSGLASLFGRFTIHGYIQDSHGHPPADDLTADRSLHGCRTDSTMIAGRAQLAPAVLIAVAGVLDAETVGAQAPLGNAVHGN